MLLDLRVVPLFSFYLMLIFCISTLLRVNQYSTVLALVHKFPARWPRLLALVHDYRHLFLGWKTLFPLVLMLLLLAANLIAGRLIWPRANIFTLGELLHVWPLVPVVALCGAAMVAFDAWGTWNVGAIDGEETEKYFDQAEYWLKSWTAPAVKWLTMGRINPRQMVDEQVRVALEGVSGMLDNSLWWVSTQAALRIGFGLSLWTSYLLHDWVLGVLEG